MKAVFLEKITRFVEWPDDAGINDLSEPFVIKVLGVNPFGKILDEIYSYQKIMEKKVVVEYISSIDEIGEVNLLYISASMEPQLEKILEYTEGKPILTFGEARGFAEAGVHVNFYLKNNKIGLEINETQVRKSNFYMSFRLLSHAKIVEPINEF